MKAGQAVIARPEDIQFAEEDHLFLKIPLKGIEVASRKNRRFASRSISQAHLLPRRSYVAGGA